MNPAQNHRDRGESRMGNMLEAKTHLSCLVETIETGTEQEVVIPRIGRPVAWLTEQNNMAQPRLLGLAPGAFRVPDTIDGCNPLIE